MTSTTMKSFAQSTGQSANQKSGSFSGLLLGKLAEGIDALNAMAALAAGHANRFMELAIQAAKVAKQTLEAAKTIPFASHDKDFNAAINPARASMFKAPGLGGGQNIKMKEKQKQDE